MSSTHESRPLINVVRLDAAAGKERQLAAAIMATVAPALATPGNLGFALHASTTNPNSRAQAHAIQVISACSRAPCSG